MYLKLYSHNLTKVFITKRFKPVKTFWKVKVLVYSLALAVAAIHTTLQASHYLCAPIDPLSVQSGSNQGFTPCLRVLLVLLCGLTWAGIEPGTSGMEVRHLNHQATTSHLSPPWLTLWWQALAYNAGWMGFLFIVAPQWAETICAETICAETICVCSLQNAQLIHP